MSGNALIAVDEGCTLYASVSYGANTSSVSGSISTILNRGVYACADGVPDVKQATQTYSPCNPHLNPDVCADWCTSPAVWELTYIYPTVAENNYYPYSYSYTKYSDSTLQGIGWNGIVAESWVSTIDEVTSSTYIVRGLDALAYLYTNGVDPNTAQDEYLFGFGTDTPIAGPVSVGGSMTISINSGGSFGDTLDGYPSKFYVRPPSNRDISKANSYFNMSVSYTRFPAVLVSCAVMDEDHPRHESRSSVYSSYYRTGQPAITHKGYYDLYGSALEADRIHDEYTKYVNSSIVLSTVLCGTTADPNNLSTLVTAQSASIYVNCNGDSSNTLYYDIIQSVNAHTGIGNIEITSKFTDSTVSVAEAEITIGGHTFQHYRLYPNSYATPDITYSFFNANNVYTQETPILSMDPNSRSSWSGAVDNAIAAAGIQAIVGISAYTIRSIGSIYSNATQGRVCEIIIGPDVNPNMCPKGIQPVAHHDNYFYRVMPRLRGMDYNRQQTIVVGDMRFDDTYIGTGRYSRNIVCDVFGNNTGMRVSWSIGYYNALELYAKYDDSFMTRLSSARYFYDYKFTTEACNPGEMSAAAKAGLVTYLQVQCGDYATVEESNEDGNIHIKASWNNLTQVQLRPLWHGQAAVMSPSEDSDIVNYDIIFPADYKQAGEDIVIVSTYEIPVARGAWYTNSVFLAKLPDALTGPGKADPGCVVYYKYDSIVKARYTYKWSSTVYNAATGVKTTSIYTTGKQATPETKVVVYAAVGTIDNDTYFPGVYNKFGYALPVLTEKGAAVIKAYNEDNKGDTGYYGSPEYYVRIRHYADDFTVPDVYLGDNTTWADTPPTDPPVLDDPNIKISSYIAARDDNGNPTSYAQYLYVSWTDKYGRKSDTVIPTIYEPNYEDDPTGHTIVSTANSAFSKYEAECEFKYADPRKMKLTPTVSYICTKGIWFAPVGTANDAAGGVRIYCRPDAGAGDGRLECTSFAYQISDDAFPGGYVRAEEEQWLSSISAWATASTVEEYDNKVHTSYFFPIFNSGLFSCEIITDKTT